MPLHTFRYAACGGANTCLDISLFWFSYHFIYKERPLNLHWLVLSPHIASLFSALCVSLPTGFYLNRYVVFQNAGLRRRIQLARYVLVVAINIVLNYIFLKFLVDYLGWYATPSKIATTAIVIMFSYFSQTFYFFRQKPAEPGF